MTDCRRKNIYLSESTTDFSTDDDDRNTRPISYQNAIDNADLNRNRTGGFENILSLREKQEPGNTLAYDALRSTGVDNCAFQYNSNHFAQPQLTTSIADDRNRKDSALSSVCSKSSLLSRTSQKLSGKKCIVFIVCIQIALVVLFVSFITVLFVMIFDLKHELDIEKSEDQENSNRLCLPCNDLILGPLEEDNQYIKTLTRKIEDGVEICCAKGANQTSGLIELLFQRREKLHIAQDTIQSESNSKCNSTGGTTDSYNRVAGHMVAGKQPPTQGSPPYTVHNWIQSASVAHSKGIQVQDSRIIVNTSGLYFVYSQIFFSNIYNGHASMNTSQALYHYVYRWNIIYPNGGTELLLKSVRTQCWAENRVYGDYTSYTAGVFTLSAGDQLFVKVSKIDSISRDSQASFFGVAKM